MKSPRSVSMFQKPCSRLALMLLLVCTQACAWAQDQVSAPGVATPVNIIVILADDAGYADFGFQGSHEALTPNIDKIADAGITYSNAYVTTPFCSPSRAGLLTGRYPQRFGYEFNLTHEPPPGVDDRFMGLAVEESTIADNLKSAGYTTIAVGKWHVGDAPQFHPNERGFDHFYGFLGGASNYHPDLQKASVGMMRDKTPVKPKEYLTDDFAREAIGYIERFKSTPFFMYLAFNAVHTPMDVLEEDMHRFKGVADIQRRRLMAMTWAMDRSVGRVMDALEKNGLVEKTLVIFTNDNGGDRIGIGADNTPLRGTKGTLLEGGIRVPFTMQWPGVIEAGSRSDNIISLLDIFPTASTLAGAPMPGDLDGKSLLTAHGQLTNGHDQLFWRYDVVASVRSGRWKLLRFPDRLPELYDVSVDAGEANNLANSHPDKVTTLLEQIFAWEGGLQHPRWNTGTFWTQEDVRRYDSTYVEQQRAHAVETLRAENE